MDPKELREKKIEDLEKMREELEDSVIDSYFDMRTGKETNVRKPRALRKDLAVLKTVIKEKKVNMSKKSDE